VTFVSAIRPPSFLTGGLRLRAVSTMFAALAALLIAGCGGKSADIDPTINWSAERLYQDAKELVAAGSWADARTRLTSIESRYPFGIYAQQALIDLAYVNWRDEEPEQALVTIDRFHQLYPNHRATDYMLYLKGLITFTPPSAFMASITGQDPAERDPKGLRRSYDTFHELVERYPESSYASDARARMTWLVNTIAMNEVHIARYYYQRNAYVAAANRAQSVITDFEAAPASEEALYIMMLSYDKLGMTDLRDDAQRVLLANYPNSVFLERGFEAETNWWNPLDWF